MKLIILLFLLSTPLITSYHEINTYQCTTKKGTNRCMIIDNYITEDPPIQHIVTYFENCPPHHHCQFLEGYTYRTCIPNFPPGFDGDNCVYNSDCFSGICSKNKCIGLKEDEPCKNTNQCKSNLACYDETNDPIKQDNKKCLPLKKENENCIIDFKEEEKNGAFGNCDKGLVCATVGRSVYEMSSKCIKIGSLPDKTSCGNPFACESGIVLHNKCAYIKIGKINRDPWMDLCEYQSSTNNGDNIEERECSHSSKGEVRHPFEGIHEFWKKYVQLYLKRINELNDDFAFNHHRYYLNDFEVRKAYINYLYGPFLSDADECVKDFWYRSHNRLRY